MKLPLVVTRRNRERNELGRSTPAVSRFTGGESAQRMRAVKGNADASIRTHLALIRYRAK
jgi:hypothetical protein